VTGTEQYHEPPGELSAQAAAGESFAFRVATPAAAIALVTGHR